MEKTMRGGFLQVVFLSLTILLTAVGVVYAACNVGSVDVAIIPGPDADGGGTLSTTDSAFDKFSFTNVPIANVNATTLANYDTVVLVTVCDPINETTASQRTDIINWVNNGGKLIIYDSECLWNDTIDYSWLPCNATTYCPGALGADKSQYEYINLIIVENNTLSDNNSGSSYFINTTLIEYETDAVGDQNVFIAKEACWCGDMLGTNARNSSYSTPPGTTGYSHAYSLYGNGLIIYNGLDIDDMESYTDPTDNDGEGHFAKIWIQELNQTWDNTSGIDDCGLPCGVVITPTETPPSVPVTSPFGLLTLAGILSIAALWVMRRK